MLTCWMLSCFSQSTEQHLLLYRHLRGFVYAYFDAITTSILIALLRSRLRMRPVVSATLPNWSSWSCNVVSKHYAADQNQAIHRMISCHMLRSSSSNLDILLPVRNSSWYVRQQISLQRLSQIYASPLKTIWLAS